MADPLPVTDEDVRAAFDTIYTVEIAGTRYTAPFPDIADPVQRTFLAGLRRVLEEDRKRVLERSA